MLLWEIFTFEHRISTRLILDIEYRISPSLIFERHPPGPQIPRYVDAHIQPPHPGCQTCALPGPDISLAICTLPHTFAMPALKQTALNYLPASLVDGRCTHRAFPTCCWSDSCAALKIMCTTSDGLSYYMFRHGVCC